MKHSRLEVFGALLPVVLFLTLKIVQLSFRFGDGNAYLYMADRLLSGQLPYRDYFLADPPLFILFLAVWRLLIGTHWLWFGLLPAILEAGSAWLIYWLLKRWNNPLAWLAPASYLFSFTILSTSDYLTGVQLVVFGVLLATFLLEKEQPLLSGIVIALALLVKLYAVCALLGLAIYLIREKQWHNLRRWLIGMASTGLLIMGPFLFLGAKTIFKDIVVHQLNRPAGNGRLPAWSFFWLKEWWLLIIGASGLLIKRKSIIIWSFGATLIFFMVFRDLYYLYLNNIFVYLVMGALILVGMAWSRGGTYKNLAITISVLTLALNLSALIDYQKNLLPQGRFFSATAVAEYVVTLPARPLYGSHEVAPLIALLSGRYLLSGYIDTNTQVFASGAQDLERVSQAVAQTGVYMLSRITDHPELEIAPTGYEGYFSKTVFDRDCQLIKAFPNFVNESYNQVGVFACKTQP
ncbi:MAG: hypothetical protein A3F25_02415 [Candidatus Yanofskybacteria bacterium RIFCSPHIGHO2_12_FULL_45_19b]|uniref:Glycosyltransferase RgtA/B/C/D-like domain-containing protein n=1 Tax=Candidatus Yanofskybacteria bacterium RIFCSPHIGHO2_12_FULL_45_19b TaxID=1802689 RepID=A0A1F8G549_9BACT|nr:MAG: hypothetical protein A3F25_02415 [Candidatus Yanofskybacteria bacterium RIFCSPHIGHO2_12_FULL_45_19b]